MRVRGLAYRILSWIAVAIGAAGLIVAVLSGAGAKSLWLVFLIGFSLSLLRWDERLPDLLHALLVTAAIFNAFCWVFDWYEEKGLYDEIAHFYSTFGLSLAAGFLLAHTSEIRFRRLGSLYGLAVFCVGMAVGAVWEIVEWIVAVIGGLHDTITDLILNGLGAFAAGMVSRLIVESANAEREPAAIQDAGAAPAARNRPAWPERQIVKSSAE